MNLTLPSVTREVFRKKLMTLGFVVLVAFAAFRISQNIIAEDFAGIAYLILLCVAGAIVVSVLRNWRNGLYFFLAWLLFEDLARKFLGNNMGIYFAKDFLVLCVYLSFFAAYRRRERDLKTFRPPFLAALLAFVWFGVLQVFNPGSTHVLYGVLGMKLYFYYAPLIVIGYAMVNSEADLRKFFHVNLALMLVIAALGIAQSILGPRFLNPAVIAEDIRLLSETYRVANSGARVYRPTSVFVSIGRFGDLLVVAWLMVLGFSGYLLLRERRGRLFTFLALAVTAAASVMCTSRGVFMWCLGSGLVAGVAFIWGAPWRQGEVLRVVRTLQRVALGIALASAVMLVAYPEAFLGRLEVYSDTLDPRSSSNELVHRARDYPLRNFLAAFEYPQWPYGYGIGTVSLGGQYVARFFNVRPSVIGVESGFGALVIEMGIGGLILWLTMAAAILISAWRVVVKLRGSPWFPLAFMIFWYAFLLLVPLTFVGLQAYQDFILNAYFWLLLGILFRLPDVAQSAQFGNVGAPTLDRRWVR